MKRIFFFLLTAAALFASCDDNTGNIGMSLTDVTNQVQIEGQNFSVSSESKLLTSISANTINGYMGRVKDSETGAYITCNFMTQLRPMTEYQFPIIDTVLVKNYDSSKPKEIQVEADSCQLCVYFQGLYGDSLALMKVVAHEMDKPFEEANTYTTDFDPIAEGMIRNEAGSIHKECTYTISNRAHSAAQRAKSTYLPFLSISLNDPYTDKDGVTYNNYGTYLMRKYYSTPLSEFSNQYTFLHDICPGFYLENKGGIGSVGKVYTTQIIVYYKGVIAKKDTIGLFSSFAGTEEVLQNTTFSQSTTVLNSLKDDLSCTYLKSPAGLGTELTLPVTDIMKGHEDDTLNTSRLFIPCINRTTTEDYYFTPPTTVLLVPSDSVDTFFKNNKLADSRSSYLATYSSTYNGYTFSNISLLVSKLYAQKQNSGLSDAEYRLSHPNWDKVMLVPVSTVYSTISSSKVLSKVSHDLSITSTRLVKGTTTDSPITINVIYSKFK